MSNDFSFSSLPLWVVLCFLTKLLYKSIVIAKQQQQMAKAINHSFTELNTLAV
jgi:hypothetical protein